MPLTLNKKPLFPHFLANLDLKYRYFNASFVGAATRFQGTYPQRKEWVKELVDCGRSRLQVGIIDHEHYPINELFDNPAPYRHRFLGPGFYLALMVQSKICLTPSGNARWSYRHYEAVQCGNIRVSTDLSGLELLIPIPSQATIFVPDHTDVLPFILSALDQIDRYQPLVRQGQTQLNQSLTRGEYDPNNPSVLYSFLKKWN